jgi:hypothetical protein
MFTIEIRRMGWAKPKTHPIFLTLLLPILGIPH